MLFTFSRKPEHPIISKNTPRSNTSEQLLKHLEVSYAFKYNMLAKAQYGTPCSNCKTYR